MKEIDCDKGELEGIVTIKDTSKLDWTIFYVWVFVLIVMFGFEIKMLYESKQQLEEIELLVEELGEGCD